jgi:AmiR/NasT family two-component response regulator
MNWRTTIASFLDPAAAQSLILLSDVSDPYLLAELVHHGGFDVLSRPFQREEVLGTLTFAYKHAQAHWPEVVTTPANRRSPAGHVS